MMGALQQRRSKKSDGDCEQPPLKPRAATPRTSCADAAALAALVFLASAAPVATQLVRRPDGTYPFEVVDVVLRAEILKLGIAFFCLACELRGLSVTEWRDRAPMPSSKGLLLTLCVGAGYQALNLLAGYGMRVLNDATLFAVIVQSKVVWTGLLGVYAFGRRLSAARIGSLILVAAGAAVCAAPKPNTDASKVRTRVTGCLLAGGAALLSAVLTVGCEAVVKRGRASLHWQNLQLYVVGILVTASTLSKQPSWGYVSYAMGALVVLEACKGLAISLVLKRTDAVVKTLATTLSIPGVAVLERLVVPNTAPMALPMLLGGSAVVLAITAHGGPDGRDTPFLAAAFALVLVGGASAARWPA